MQDALMASLERLFTPFPYGNRTLRNRVVMAPMTRGFSPSSIPGDNVVQYYRRRAAGGAGLLITEGTYIDHPSANGYVDVPAFFGAALEGWRKVVDAVHAEGALIVPQLWHVGSIRRPHMGPVPGVPGVGPEEIRENGQVVVRRMSHTDIREVVASYARAARAARDTGFDGLEIHAAHGYLIDEFFWEAANRRTDEYGGPLANRTRLATEVVAAVRAAVGPNFPIQFRWSQWKMSDYGVRIARSPEELGELLAPLAAAGVDLFHVSTRRFWEPAFAGSAETLAACTRRMTGKPVIAVGSVGMAAQHESSKLEWRKDRGSAIANLDKLTAALANDEFDLIATGRGILADPEWPNKMRAGAFDQLVPLTEAALGKLW